MDLTTKTSVVITDAIKFVQNSGEKLIASQKEEEDDKGSNQPDYDDEDTDLEEEEEERHLDT
jgi:hypothetical protein